MPSKGGRNVDFKKLIDYLESLEDKYGIPACDCVVYQNHSEIFRHMCGFSDSEHTALTSAQDIYWFYSITKLFTCVAVMQLVERGELRLDAAVSRYLPEYERMNVKSENGLVPATGDIRIIDLLTMSAGLIYDLDLPAFKMLRKTSRNQATTRDVIRVLAEEPLQFQPGSHFKYSFCHDVLAVIVEIISGQKFGDYLVQNIFNPLGLKDMSFSPDTNARQRMQAQYSMCPNINSIIEIVKVNLFKLSSNYESGGAGLLGSVNDCILFLDALANDGIGANGHQILRAETIDLMRTNQLDGVRLDDFRTLNRKGYGYGLGVRTLIDPSASRSPVGEFGWDGAAGSYALVDPQNRLSIFFASHVLGIQAFARIIHPTIRELIYECIFK